MTIWQHGHPKPTRSDAPRTANPHMGFTGRRGVRDRPTPPPLKQSGRPGSVRPACASLVFAVHRACDYSLWITA
eukprot:5836521-Prymnesium_polylepis.1